MFQFPIWEKFFQAFLAHYFHSSYQYHCREIKTNTFLIFIWGLKFKLTKPNSIDILSEDKIAKNFWKESFLSNSIFLIILFSESTGDLEEIPQCCFGFVNLFRGPINFVKKPFVSIYLLWIFVLVAKMDVKTKLIT